MTAPYVRQRFKVPAERQLMEKQLGSPKHPRASLVEIFDDKFAMTYEQISKTNIDLSWPVVLSHCLRRAALGRFWSHAWSVAPTTSGLGATNRYFQERLELCAYSARVTIAAMWKEILLSWHFANGATFGIYSHLIITIMKKFHKTHRYELNF